MKIEKLLFLLSTPCIYNRNAVTLAWTVIIKAKNLVLVKMIPCYVSVYKGSPETMEDDECKLQGYIKNLKKDTFYEHKTQYMAFSIYR